MKKRYFVIAALLLSIVTAHFTYAEVTLGKEYNSPDKHYFVTVKETKDYDQLIVINNKIKNTVEAKFEEETPVNELQWGPDSACIIVELHIANGSFCNIIYLNKGSWIEIGYKPKFKGNPKKDIFEKTCVNSIKIADGYALITYFCRDMSPNGSYYKEREAIIKVNLKTRKSQVISDHWLAD